ncbi:MAG: phosphatidylethanolamine-binding protein [Oscillospiraceae bacterium]|nr:phosphatidylethanolamine-binding protein [Oscillospiraceae bacterium]
MKRGIIALLGCLLLTGCAAQESTPVTLTSESLHDGTWDAVITHTDAGEDRSPQLTWTPVEGAACYRVFMLDPDGGNWLHWKSGPLTQTQLPEGAAAPETYVGPYPPAGQTHTYVVCVAALREDAEAPGQLDAANDGLTQEALRTALDTPPGNVLAWGTLEGRYTVRDER